MFNIDLKCYYSKNEPLSTGSGIVFPKFWTATFNGFKHNVGDGVYNEG